MIQKTEDGFTVSFTVFVVGKKGSEEYSKWYEPVTDDCTIEYKFREEILEAFKRGLFEFENCECGTTIFLNMNSVERIEVSL